MCSFLLAGLALPSAVAQAADLLSVTKTGTGSGSVIPNTGTLIWNGSNGTGLYDSGAVVALSAVSVNGSSFVGWSGACTGTGVCQVTMDAAKTVLARFDSASSSLPQIPTTGLVAFYDFAGDAVDSINGQNGMLHGGANTSSHSGYPNGARSFSGVLADSIQLPGSILNQSSLTLNFWISTKDNNFGLLSGANTINDNEYLLYYTNGLEVTYHNVIAQPSAITARFNDGLWHMITVVTTPSETKIFLDGTLKSSNNYSLSPNLAVESIWIGQEQDSLNGRFDVVQSMSGSIDDLSIHNRALTGDEIASIFGNYNPGVIVGGVIFPNGMTSFADEVVSFTPGIGTVPPNNDSRTAIGSPQGGIDGQFLSLGWGGELVLKFTDNALTTSGDKENDLWIYEIGPAVEPTYVSISENGFDWISLDLIQGSTRGIDIDAYTANGVVPGREYHYVKLLDSNQHLSSYPVAGADIDAVGAIRSINVLVSISAEPSFSVYPGNIVTLNAVTPTIDAYTYQWSINCPSMQSQPSLEINNNYLVRWLAPVLPVGVSLGYCSTILIATDLGGNVTTTNYLHQIVNRINQTLSFGNAPTLVVGGTASVSATATSGLAVNLTSTTLDVCSVSGNTVTGIKAGNCTILAYQDGGSTYSAAEETMTFPVTSGNSTITVTTTGTGRGDVNSDPAGIACENGIRAGCSADFMNGTQITLFAVPDFKSEFVKWTAGCTGTVIACDIDLNADTSVSATFNLRQLVMSSGPKYFATIQDAYDASSGGLIKMRGQVFNEDLLFSLPIRLSMNGGMSDLWNQVGYSYVKGSLKISNGSVTISNLIIQ